MTSANRPRLHSCRNRIRRAALGFSLVELLVVITIVGVVSAVAVPAFARFMRGGAAAAASELVSGFLAARDAASVRGIPTTVMVELVSGRYWVVVAQTPGGLPDTLRQGNLRRAPQVRLTGGQHGWATTTYDAMGRARGTPVIVADGEETYEISADRWTGSVAAERR